MVDSGGDEWSVAVLVSGGQVVVIGGQWQRQSVMVTGGQWWSLLVVPGC